MNETERLLIRNAMYAFLLELEVPQAAALSTALSHKIQPVVEDQIKREAQKAEAKGYSDGLIAQSGAPRRLCEPPPRDNEPGDSWEDKRDWS